MPLAKAWTSHCIHAAWSEHQGEVVQNQQRRQSTFHWNFKRQYLKYANIFCWENVKRFCSAKASLIFFDKIYQCIWLYSSKNFNKLTSQQVCYANNALNNWAHSICCLHTTYTDPKEFTGTLKALGTIWILKDRFESLMFMNLCTSLHDSSILLHRIFSAISWGFPFLEWLQITKSVL